MSRAAGVRDVARRCVTVPAFVALVPLALALLLVTVALAPLSLLAGRRGRAWQPQRLALYAVVYLLADLTGVGAALVVRLRCLGGGAARRERLVTLNYRLLARLLGFLVGCSRRIFALSVEVDPPLPRPGARPPDGMVVLARHAGPGDSILLVHGLLCGAGLRPQVVLKEFLRWDPCMDLVLSCLPHCFVPRHADTDGRTPDAIGALAAGLRPGDALVLFPEGGNFTERRRSRSIRWLVRTGQLRRAARARRQHHVLPPRTAGPLAALSGARDAGAAVVFVAHTGLDHIDSPSRLWSSIPLRRPVRATWWSVPGRAIPTGPEAREPWLTGQWARVDAWIGRQGSESAPPRTAPPRTAPS
ncbi:1-acyl-sn-glycerol-3-phosphate acyltransferase [Streptomyces sp. NBC_00083]|uniref:1-acyl-sn-glycerol-3-phosphate acyltransferase n=1 Tax=Streptomyces sp. NBC_00083 TaxID=2975647 RepID=UPI002252F067|nr:1-acyl-sn-glycerol-3-phosphate acyltransferase [Streptomyces sp. NBC_00083]MCX5382351.1 1-acyl-sn-glycerol-3-phosphate acyltransferase [Streptomyces sp. NBC_00083]